MESKKWMFGRWLSVGKNGWFSGSLLSFRGCELSIRRYQLMFFSCSGRHFTWDAHLQKMKMSPEKREEKSASSSASDPPSAPPRVTAVTRCWSLKHSRAVPRKAWNFHWTPHPTWGKDLFHLPTKHFSGAELVVFGVCMLNSKISERRPDPNRLLMRALW